MEELIKILEEIKEGFAGTIQAFGQLPTPVVGSSPTSPTYSKEDGEEKKKKKKEDKQE